MIPEKDKATCDECGWDGVVSDLLEGHNPFNPAITISGCPECYSIDCFYTLCDEPGCKDRAECGMPTDGGYRTTCSQHVPAPAPF